MKFFHLLIVGEKDSPTVLFLAPQDALEVMYVSEVVIQATRACLPPPWLPPTPPWRNLGGTSWKSNWHRNLCATSWKRHWHRNLRSLLTGTEIWDQSLAQKFEISSCVLKLATKNFGTRNEKMWSQKFVWLALEKRLAQKFVIQKLFHFWGGRQIIFTSDEYILVQYKMESLM